MIRLVGSVCILSGGVLAVRQSARKRRQKGELLAELIRALRRMEESVDILQTPIPRLLEEQAKRCGKEARPLFEETLVQLREGVPLSEAWSYGCGQLQLEQEENRALQSAFDGWNINNRSVCNGISLACDFLERAQEEQEQRQPEQAKRTAALYLSGAALLVILLI